MAHDGNNSRGFVRKEFQLTNIGGIKMKSLPLYCSTGTIISRHNGFDYTLMYKVLPSLVAECGFDGYEFMMLNAFYDKTREISEQMEKHGMVFSVFHAEKDIGTLMSNGSAEEDAEALRLFRINCGFASALGAKKIVLHLWGGHESDKKFDHNLSFVPELSRMAEEQRLTLLVENVPCVSGDPLSHWRAIRSTSGAENVRFLYDTRFGEFHRQHDDILNSEIFGSGLVRHVHISDFIGAEREFSRLRPILHPGQGQIDFAHIFSVLRSSDYSDSITLESPVAREDGTLDIPRLAETMKYISGEMK